MNRMTNGYKKEMEKGSIESTQKVLPVSKKLKANRLQAMSVCEAKLKITCIFHDYTCSTNLAAIDNLAAPLKRLSQFRQSSLHRYKKK